MMNPEDIFSNLPQLETERLILRKMVMDDAADMFEYASDPEVTRFVAWQPHESLEDSKDYLSFVVGQQEKGEVANWGMVLKENNKFVGTCGYIWWSPEHSLAEIGYAMSRRYWNMGLMTEAVKEVIRFGFDVMVLNRLEAQHEVHNEASGRVMQKAGMKFEAVLKQRVFAQGQYHDVKLYAILRSEFYDRA